MKAGDAILAMLTPNEPKKHFWVIILAILDDNTAILGNITSGCKDHTLPIHNNEYSELTKPTSYFNYPEVRVESLQELENKLKTKQIKRLPSISCELLRQIQDGLLNSKHTPIHLKELFRLHSK